MVRRKRKSALKQHKMHRFRSSCTCAKYHLGPIFWSIRWLYVSWQWKPWSDNVDAQADLHLRWRQVFACLSPYIVLYGAFCKVQRMWQFNLTLKAPRKFWSRWHSIFYIFVYFSEKTRLDFSCESSAAGQTIHTKSQDLFSLKNKKKIKMSSAANFALLGALRIKCQSQLQQKTFWFFSFVFFRVKKYLTFHVNCLLSRWFTWTVVLFSVKKI